MQPSLARPDWRTKRLFPNPSTRVAYHGAVLDRADASERTEPSASGAERRVAQRTERVQAFFDQPDRYLTRNRAIPMRVQLVAELAGDVAGGRVIDLGCGDGSLSRQFVGRASCVTLVDTSARMLERASAALSTSQSGRVRCLNADLLDVPEEEYELVLCVGVLAHLASVEDAVAKIGRLMTPGGRCVLQLTDRGHPAGRLLYACHAARVAARPDGYALNRLSLASLVNTASGNGLKTKATRRYPFVPRGTGRLPERWVVEVERHMLGSPLLRVLRSEVMVSFTKEAAQSTP